MRTVLAIILATLTLHHAAPVAAADEPVYEAGAIGVQPNYGLRSTVAVFACYVVAPDAAGVSIDTCTYNGDNGSADAPGLGVPGPVVATTGTAINAEHAPAEICYSGTITFYVGTVVPFNGCNLVFSP